MSRPPLLETVREQAAPGHTALLVVDMQNDFCAPGFAAARARRDLAPFAAITPKIAALIESGRAAGALICHIGFGTLPNHRGDSAPWMAQRRRAAFSGTEMAVVGTPGAEFIEPLKPQPGDLVVYKQRYSGFKGTNLEMLLRANDIRTVVLVGGSTNVCVESTLRDAFEIGFYACIVSDATCSWDMSLHEATLKTVDRRFGLVTSTQALTDLWSEGELRRSPGTDAAA